MGGFCTFTHNLFMFKGERERREIEGKRVIKERREKMRGKMREYYCLG